MTLFEILKTYATIITTRNFQKISIPKLPVFTTEDGIRTLKSFIGKLQDWKKINDLIPILYKKNKNMIKTGNAGIFAASLELVKDGKFSIKQNNLYEDSIIHTKPFKSIYNYVTSNGLERSVSNIGKLKYIKTTVFGRMRAANKEIISFKIQMEKKKK